MNNNIALTFQLANNFLKEIFPPSVLNYLNPYFECADNTLGIISDSDYSHWHDKVRILPRAQKLIPAKIEEDVVAVVYQGLFEGKKIRARYKPRYGDEAEYDLNPLGLVFRESVIYLVATMWDYVDPRHLALHRFRHSELLEEDAATPEDFNLDKYLAEGSFEYGEKENEKIKLKALFFDWSGHHLLETPLSEDQKAVELEDGTLQIEATTNNSAQIRWWLLGFGDNVEVLEPVDLRSEFEKIAIDLIEKYKA